MVQLQSLSLQSLSTTYYPTPLLRLPSEERVALPFLTCLRLIFRGNASYLESFVTRIDAPRLEDIEITFLDHPIVSLSMLSEFIDRIEMHKSHRQAHISFSEHTISVSLIQPGTHTRLILQLFCRPLHMQLFSMTRFCLNFSTILFNVGELCVSALRHLEWTNGFDSRRWPELLSPFTGVKVLHLNTKIANDSTNFVHALQLPERQYESVLPALLKLCIQQPGPRHVPLRETVVALMVSRRLSGNPLEVEYERLCNINEQIDTGTTTYTRCTPYLRHNLLTSLK
jgi:hypothetical protein